jgi:hypothetical protein
MCIHVTLVQSCSQIFISIFLCVVNFFRTKNSIAKIFYQCPWNVASNICIDNNAMCCHTQQKKKKNKKVANFLLLGFTKHVTFLFPRLRQCNFWKTKKKILGDTLANCSLRPILAW